MKVPDAKLGYAMFCPEDGTDIPHQPDRTLGGAGLYGPCSSCGMTWEYDLAWGAYRPLRLPPQPASYPTLKDVAEGLKVAGREHRQLGEDIRTAHLLDVLERGASEEGKAEYILSNEHTLKVDFPRPPTYRYVDYVGPFPRINTEISRDRALQLLAERRHHD